MTDDQIREGIRRAADVARLVGPMHANWDLIADAEAILDGRPSIVDREVVEKMFGDLFPDLQGHG